MKLTMIFAILLTTLTAQSISLPDERSNALDSPIRFVKDPVKVLINGRTYYAWDSVDVINLANTYQYAKSTTEKIKLLKQLLELVEGDKSSLIEQLRVLKMRRRRSWLSGFSSGSAVGSIIAIIFSNKN